MRLFLALPLPSAVLPLVSTVQASVMKTPPRGRAVFRPVPLNTHGHITLTFLGESPESVPEKLQSAVQTAIEGLNLQVHPRVRVARSVVGFGRDLIVAVAPARGDEQMNKLQRAVYNASLSVHKQMKDDTRPFVPHVTVARARGGRRKSSERRTAVKLANEELAQCTEVESYVEFKADSVVLFESTKDSDDKVIYTKLWSYNLEHGRLEF